MSLLDARPSATDGFSPAADGYLSEHDNRIERHHLCQSASCCSSRPCYFLPWLIRGRGSLTQTSRLERKLASRWRAADRVECDAKRKYSLADSDA